MRQRETSRQVWAKWRELVSEQGQSGQSVAVFCGERGLCAPHFYAWKKRLREADAGQDVLRAPLTKFVEVQVGPAGWGGAGAGQAEAARNAGAAGVVRGASLSRSAGDARVEILLKNGRSLRVGPGFDAELVRALVAVVESAA
jgi:hypothetical protein